MTHPTEHTFTALRVSLPRLELERRNHYFEAKKLHCDLAPQVVGRDSARLCLETAVPVSRKPVAIIDAGDFCLAPGETAIVLARWDRKVPEEDFWCEESSLSGITVQAGICTGSSQEVMLCGINESELEYTFERGLPLAEAHEWIARPMPVSGERVA